MKLEATHLRDSLYAVRPEGQLGTCGWSPEPWVVAYIKADSPEQAVAIQQQRKTRENKK
jgi:hypothetical protein